MSDETREKSLCAKCVSNKHFAKWIRANGFRGKCDFDHSHGSSRKVVSVEELAEQTDQYFRAKYQLGGEYPYFEEDSDSPSYHQYGAPYQEVLAEELGSDEELVQAISDKLPDYDEYDIRDGAEAFYNDFSNYELISEAKKRDEDEMMEHWYENRFSYQWEDFSRTIQFERRFFKIKELLDELFGRPEEYEKARISPTYNLSAGTKICRARIQSDNFTYSDITANPAAILGAPPSEKTKAGRMNVEFIPAFYAAFNEETAIAEMRPSINDQLVIGDFLLEKDILVFDFTVFDKPPEKGLLFHRHSRYEVITELQAEISKPISPNERQRKYIPTQAVAEYLREYFGCDAVIYKSSVHKNGSAENRNIVLLNKGTPFVGAPESPLRFSKHKTVKVHDVTYLVKKNKF